MNRKKFIEELDKALSGVPDEEKESALEYYEEYFDEAGAENEDDVLEELGSPKRIAAQIKSEYAVKLLDDEDIHTAKKGLTAFKWVLIGICSAPLSIPAAIVLVTLAICAFAVFLCIVVSLAATVVGAVAASVFSLVIGVLAVPVSVSTALLFTGGGLMGLGVCALLGYLLIIGTRAAVSAVVRRIKKSNESRKAKKSESFKEQGKWKYKGEAR